MPSPALMSGAAVCVRAPVTLRRAKPRTRHLFYPSNAQIASRSRFVSVRADASASAVDTQQQEYTKWRLDRNITSPSVEVAYFGDVDDDVMRYRGVKAVASINENDVLVELPRVSCLVLMDDAQLPFPEFCSNSLWSALGSKNKWQVKVALNLLHEKSLGNESEFKVYVDQLPKQFDLLSQWSRDELKELQYPPVVRAAEAQSLEDDDAFNMIQNLSPETAAKVTKTELIWALNMVRSRVFSGRLRDNAETKKNLLPRALAAGTAFAAFLTSQTQEGRWLAVFAMLALVVFDSNAGDDDESDGSDPNSTGNKLAYVLMPLIDAFNHRKFPKKTEFEFSRDKFRLRSPTRYEKNTEIFISYGLIGNDELLTRYGFADVNSGHDTYVFEGLLTWLSANHEPLQKASGAAPNRLRKIRDARLETYLKQAVFVGDGTGDANLEWALRALLATPEEWDRAGGDVGGFKLGGGGPEKKAMLALKDACAARLLEMGTSVTEDEQLLRSGSAADRARVAVEYRLGKKKILQKAVVRYT